MEVKKGDQPLSHILESKEDQQPSSIYDITEKDDTPSNQAIEIQSNKAGVGKKGSIFPNIQDSKTLQYN